MFRKNLSFCILLLLVIGNCLAEPPRFRQRQRLPARRTQRLRLRPQPARQEVENVTPYPSASELKPEVPFEPESQPELIYGPPDQTYGPPDQTYGPPDIDQLPPTTDLPTEFSPNPEAEEFIPARLQNRRPNQVPLTGKLQATTSQKLTQVSALTGLPPFAAALPVPLPATQQYYIVNQPLAYSAQFQSW